MPLLDKVKALLKILGLLFAAHIVKKALSEVTIH